MTAFANKVTIGYTSDIKNLVAMFGEFKPTVIVSVPRVFEKVYNTAELSAQDSGKGAIFAMAARAAIEYSEAMDRGGPGLVLRAKHALFDRLVYGKLRAATGGNCRASISGGAPLGVRLGHFYRGIGLTIYEGYGLTETSAAITANRIGELKIGTVGKLLPGNSMAVANDGELLVRGGVVFGGYWRNEKATDEAIVDGWFHTGDGGGIDDESYLMISDRKKDVIISGGENVSSIEVEDVLFQHPDVAEVAVIGVPDEKWGELVTALVVLQPGSAARPDELIAFCRERMAGFKCPKRVELRDELARTATGKLQKFKLREPFWEGHERKVN
jgi:long-chain acyl-CoA synthetase